MKLINCDSGDFVWCQVVNNETLQDVAKRYSVIEKNIIRHNPNIELYEGEIVKVLNKNNSYHIVKPMETLEIIANKYNVKVEDLIKQNNLKSNRLFIGQNLKIEQ